mmetsp:Transcript_106490/g.283239  ORF Transcript_106490/g.283239 Transcript_106490/m.283239 type:complete len:223 (-) Transcript_106490:184-852(-)
MQLQLAQAGAEGKYPRELVHFSVSPFATGVTKLLCGTHDLAEDPPVRTSKVVSVLELRELLAEELRAEYLWQDRRLPLGLAVECNVLPRVALRAEPADVEQCVGWRDELAEGLLKSRPTPRSVRHLSRRHPCELPDLRKPMRVPEAYVLEGFAEGREVTVAPWFLRQAAPVDEERHALDADSTAPGKLPQQRPNGSQVERVRIWMARAKPAVGNGDDQRGLP